MISHKSEYGYTIDDLVQTIIFKSQEYIFCQISVFFARETDEFKIATFSQKTSCIFVATCEVRIISGTKSKTCCDTH